MNGADSGGPSGPNPAPSAVDRTLNLARHWGRRSPLIAPYRSARDEGARLLRAALRRQGYSHYQDTSRVDFDPATRSIVAQVKPYTETSPERVAAVIDAIRYLTRHEIGGAVVECGVWRGGSSMAAALALLDAGRRDRELYLFDTFAGMTESGPHDVAFDGEPASRRWPAGALGDDEGVSVSAVRENLLRTGYPRERLHFVPGDVLETLPDAAPDRIALLRLDTDWYESTRHELEQLYPRLVGGGVLIIDDYGHWQGARRAVDEYLAGHPVLLQRIDYTGRLTVKPFD